MRHGDKLTVMTIKQIILGRQTLARVMLALTIGHAGCQSENRVSNATSLSPHTGAATTTASFAADQQPDTLVHVVDVLRDAGYTIDRADYRQGVITTVPKGVTTAVEPWSADRLGGGQAWAATLSPMRRVVRVTSEPIELQDAAADTDNQAMNKLRWEVQLERYTSPRRRVINASRGRVFSSLNELPEPWSKRGMTAMYWQPLGRDVLTEQRLAARFTAR